MKKNNKLIALTDIISAALSRTDPEGLIRMGAPAHDEYDLEGAMIAEQVLSGEKLSLEMVHSVFQYAFGKAASDNPESYQSAYKEIEKALAKQWN